MAERTTVPDREDETHDETKWMAIAIELLAVCGAIVFALVQSQ